MFLMTLAGILVVWFGESDFRGHLRAQLIAGSREWRRHWFSSSAFLAGAAPRAIGRWVEPYDAYNEQFSWSLDSRLLAEHGRILLLECLPRLVAGHRLPGLEADPDPALLGTGARSRRA